MNKASLKNRFVVSRMYLTLYVGFIFAAIFLMTYTQSQETATQQLMYDITIRQILFAIIGFMFMLMLVRANAVVFDWNNRYEPEALDVDRGWLLYGGIGMMGARVLGGLVSVVSASSIILLNLTISLNSAIFEELIFCPLGLLFYIIFKKLFKDEFKSIVASTLLVAVLFAIIHVGVYGVSLAAMLYLVIGRGVYNIVFLKTRTFMTTTVAHVGHNFLVSFLGV